VLLEKDNAMHKLINMPIAPMLGLLIAFAAVGQTAVAQQSNAAQATATEGDTWAYFLYIFAFDRSVRSGAQARRNNRRQMSTINAYLRAVEGLRLGQPSVFNRFHAELKQLAGDTQRAFSDSKNAGFAKDLLSTLPDSYVPGFVFLLDDGTPVADPDAFIRSQLMRERENPSGEGGDGAD
jgi:hypothetical protein